MSIAMLVFAGVAIAGATGAFFSDTETSTGNTFTAGEIDLTVDSKQHYNGNVCEEVSPDTYKWTGNADYPEPGTSCDGTWEKTDLGVSHKFFNFDDVKPGDEGENTISLHVESNDAYACAYIDVIENDDVDCTEPEDEAEGDSVCNNSVPSADMDGELADNLEFFAWYDLDGDNVYEANEPHLFSNVSGPASDVLNSATYALGDPQIGALSASQTVYIGLAWCAGDMTVDINNYTIDCDGGPMGNDTQTDSFVADIEFYVEQARNNDTFTCI